MKLSKIYSNKSFKTISFNGLFNVVLGKVTKPKDKKTDSHNLGKSIMIEIIDFLMLKEIGKEHFLNKHIDRFADYEFFLEIELNDGSYLTIKRAANPATKISFKKHYSKNQDFTSSTQWDKENIPIKKAQEFLNGFLNFNVLNEWSYRKSISYFLRTQKDYLDVFRLNKFIHNVDMEWKPLMFSMLGFNGSKLKEKYGIDKDLQKNKNLITELELHHSVNAEEIDKIKGVIQLKTDEKNQVESKLDKFDFYGKEKQINLELVESIEEKISALNTAEYGIDYEIKKIENSLENKATFDLNEIKKVFEETKIHFPNSLSRSYENLVEFNKQLFEERVKYLRERLEKLVGEKRAVNVKLVDLNKKRMSSLSVIKDMDSFKKFKSYQKDVITLEAEIVNLDAKITSIDSLVALGEKQKQLQDKSDIVKKEILEQVSSGNELYSNIRRTFSQIVKEVINRPALISIRLNKSGNIEFQTNLQNVDQSDITAAGEGTTYKKILCAAFDLAILINYSKRSFFKFVYHDGILEGLDDRKKTNLITLVKNICQENSLQYIMTTIEDDLPRDERGEKILFEQSEIALELTDEGDKGRLFEIGF